jgi:hypothetical protein
MVYPEPSDRTKYILLNTYHSGTLNTSSPRAKDFFAGMQKKGIKVYAVGVNKGPDYESAELFGTLGIIPLKNISPVAAYIKLWILLQMGENISEKLTLSLSGDIES